MRTLKLGFLASHGGSNMQAIIDAIKSDTLNAEACAVVSNNSTSGAMERANNENIPHYHISTKTHGSDEQVEDAIIKVMEDNKVEIVILAGYMKKIGSKLIQHFSGKILNIHPALLPDFGGKGMYGMNVHNAVIAAGAKVSGPTIHVVDEKYDHGRILAQKEVPVLENDSPDALAKRVLAAEHVLYAETLKKISEGTLEL